VDANFPEITMRTAENWMLFAETILARAQADAASAPLLLGSLELNGQSHDSILQLVPEVMDGKGMMHFMRECRLLRRPTRRRRSSREPVSADEATREQSARARRLWERIVANFAAGEKVLTQIDSAEDLKRYLEVAVAAGKKLRAALKPCSKVPR
jgi:hypothetical protein